MLRLSKFLLSLHTTQVTHHNNLNSWPMHVILFLYSLENFPTQLINRYYRLIKIPIYHLNIHLRKWEQPREMLLYCQMHNITRFLLNSTFYNLTFPHCEILRHIYAL